MKSNFLKITYALLIVTLLSISMFHGGHALPADMGSVRNEGFKRGYNPETGRLAFIGGDIPIFVHGASGIHSMAPQDQAVVAMNIYGPEFGLRNPSGEMHLINAKNLDNGRSSERFQQYYQGIPVLGGEMIVNLNGNGDLLSMSGEVSPELNVGTQPAIMAKQARQTALDAISKWYQLHTSELIVNEPELWLYDESLIRESIRPVELVWRMEVSAVDIGIPLREMVLVNAQTGGISLHFNQEDTAWKTLDPNSTDQGDSKQTAKTASPFLSDYFIGNFLVSTAMVDFAGSADFQLLNGVQIRTYTANNTSSLPGTLLCTESQPNCTNGINPDADKAHSFAADTYIFYDTHHNRSSYDNMGSTLISSVEYETNFQNAYWNGSQMVYGDNYAVDDVAGHELTHGVTGYESNLIYLYQSGAINESFSDLWGEFVDQTNGAGNDASNVKWLIGEDLPDGDIRDMSNPSAYPHYDPDKITSSYYYKGISDNGGVHTNSGVNNKAVFLLTDGGSFNGKSVSGIGMEKTIAIYYEVQTNLLGSGANYTDLYFALGQACQNLIGGTEGITENDCTQVQNATQAVEMHLKPSTTIAIPEACSAGLSPSNMLFLDDMESGFGKWQTQSSTNDVWDIIPFGLSDPGYSLFGQNISVINNSSVTTKADVSLPSGSNYRLLFKHYFDLEAYYDQNNNIAEGYDGGVVEYSTNQGTSWVDAQPLLVDGQDYNANLSSDWGNPLGGRAAFSGGSFGTVGSLYDLSSLAGQNIRFRWRLGSDTGTYWTGWYIDDVVIYECLIVSPEVINITRVNANPTSASSVEFTVTFSKPVTGVDETDFTLTTTGDISGASISSLIGSGTTYTVNVYTGTGLGTIRLDLNASGTGIQDLEGADLNGGFTSGEVYEIVKSTEVNVSIGGTLMDTYNILSGESEVETYLGENGGPVVVTSNTGEKIIASYLQFRRPGTTGGWTGITQTMGLTDAQISDKYVFPHYDKTDPTRYNSLQLANFDSVPTTVIVEIGGVERGRFPLDVGSSQNVTFDGVKGGPVEVYSDNGADIVASLYELKRAKTTGLYTGQTQMMGLPWSDLSDTYVIPRYNYTLQDLLPHVVFANVDDIPREITVTIGGTLQGTYTLASGESRVETYLGVNGGPVVVESDNGAKIIASYLQFRRPGTTGGWTGITQTIALTAGQISDRYAFPHYDYTDPTRYNSLQLANFDSVPTTVIVEIGGVERGTFPLDVGSSQNVTFAGVNAGPVVVYSDNGADIVASLYELKRAKTTGLYTGQTQMMGLPWLDLSDTYVIPRYNYTLKDLLPHVVFGLP